MVFSQKNSNRKAIFQRAVIFVIFSLLILNCEKKTSENPSQQALSFIAKSNTQIVGDRGADGQVQEKNEKERSQDLRKKADLIRFLASIEKETLKVVQPSLTTTQWEVISYAFDKFVGIKKAHAGFFCHQFDVVNSSKDFFEIFATCEKPVKKLADIRFAETSDVIFYSKNWAPVIGEFPSLTAPDRNCHFVHKETVIASFVCKNTIYALPPEMVEEMRLERFEYDRSAHDQVSIEGGVFKDLVKRRDLKVKVPLSGAIEIVEKELKVRDDFEHLLKKPKR